METKEATEPPPNQPSGAQLPLSQTAGTEPLIVQTTGTEPLSIQPTGTEPLNVQPSGTESLTTEASGSEPAHIQPSGIQTQVSPLSGEQPTKTASPVETPSAPMPSFTSHGPGSARINSPIRGETLRSPTKTTPVGEKAKAREEGLADLVRRQRDGTWDGVPRGFSMVNERLVQNIKSKDAQKPEEVTALLTLGSPKISTNKSTSEDEGLGEALHDLLNDEGAPAVNEGSVSPLPSLRGESHEDDPNTAVDYGTDGTNDTDDSDILRVFEEEDNQPQGIQSQDAQRNNQPSGIQEARTHTHQPVLTQQGVIDLVSKDAMTFAPDTGWRQRKQGYCNMLKGYESPNGNTVSVAVDLAALIIMSAVSESSIRNTLQIQQAANEKLMQQAEEHRKIAQKQFTDGMARMQKEQEKTIAEAARIRDEYANSAMMAQISYDTLMDKVEGNQNSNVISLQMAVLKKKNQEYERDLQEINEKHEEELQERQALCDKYRRDLDRANRKNQALEKAKKDFEDQVMSGVVPQIEISSGRPQSVDSSPELHAHKRPKIDSGKSVSVERRQPYFENIRGRESERESSHVTKTSAYTMSSKDKLNLGIMTKDPATIAAPTPSQGIQAKAASSNQAKAVSSNAQVVLYSREREIYDKAYNEAMSSSGPTTRSDTKDKPVKTYPGMHPRHEAYQMQKDAEEAALIRKAMDQAKADKAKAAKAQADNAMKAGNNQAKAANKEREQDKSSPLVTKDQKCAALKIWKELLIQTNDYLPHQKRTKEEDLKEVKILRAAMGSFRALKLQGMASLQDQHEEFVHLQEKYYIPKLFCMPEEFFREEQLDYNVAYHRRCCSVYDFYHMLSCDNPCYIDHRDRRSLKLYPAAQEVNRSIPPLLRTREEPPRATSTHQSPRQELPVVQDDGNRSRPPAVYPPGTSSHQAFRLTKNHPSYKPKPEEKRVNPSYNPFIHVGNQPIRQDIVSFQSTNPSHLDWEQRASAEKAEVRRKAPPKNAPIPSDGDETNTDGESDLLFANKLVPEAQQQIRALNKTIRRIKSRDYESGYSKTKAQAITAAETDRLKGLDGPDYLAGVRPPWYSDQGQAPIHYDEHQVEILRGHIARIRENNTVTCQLEYTANKGGPGGQARR